MAQPAHTLEPEKEYEPAGQLEHVIEVVAVVDVEYFPATHSTHVPLCVYWPAGHESVQLPLSAGENLPEPHAVQLDAPAGE